MRGNGRGDIGVTLFAPKHRKLLVTRYWLFVSIPNPLLVVR